ncbi:MAG: hypothetical protein AB7O62_26425 [Pirellulales bacterium]
MFGFNRQPVPTLRWYTPRWSYVPKLWHEFRGIFRPMFVVRSTLAAFTVFSAIVAAVKWANPLLQLDFLWKTLFAVPALYGLLLVHAAILAVVPEHVVVRPDRILVQHGQGIWHVPAKEIVATRIIVFSSDHIRLRITYVRGSKQRSRTLGVAPGVDLAKLAEILPVPPKIRDARGRSRKAPALPV